MERQACRCGGHFLRSSAYHIDVMKMNGVMYPALHLDVLALRKSHFKARCKEYVALRFAL